jgi:tetrahedral aminopeptidase
VNVSDRAVDVILPPLLSAYGPSGRESGIRAALRRGARGLGTMREDATGNLILHRTGKGPRLLLAAPMDAPGVIVTRVDGTGQGRIAILGSRAPVELIGATALFQDGRRAVIGYERPKGSKDGTEIEADQLFLETGLSGKEAGRLLPVGSVAALEDRPVRLGDLWCAANLDNRASCATVLSALRSVRAPRYDLHVVWSAQSDLGARGAATGAFGVDPELAIVVDVAHVDSRSGGMAIGQGPALGLKEDGYVAHPEALALLKRAASAARIRTQWLIRDWEGSDARAIRAARFGVPTALVAIPARRSGGPPSIVHARDLAQTAALIAALLKAPPRKSTGGAR